MYNAISGILCHKGLELIRVDNNGIEWEFAVASRSVDAFGVIGDQVRVLCWLLHREDQLRLFGFPSETDRAVFVQLLSVDGIGPKQALKILGGIGASELERALDAEDLARLEAIPGLGKKTAQKLVFTLKGKLPSAGTRNSDTHEPHEDIIRALSEMGYERKRAADIVRRLASADGKLPSQPDERERELFRQAIVELSGS